MKRLIAFNFLISNNSDFEKMTTMLLVDDYTIGKKSAERVFKDLHHLHPDIADFQMKKNQNFAKNKDGKYLFIDTVEQINLLPREGKVPKPITQEDIDLFVKQNY